MDRLVNNPSPPVRHTDSGRVRAAQGLLLWIGLGAAAASVSACGSGSTQTTQPSTATADVPAATSAPTSPPSTGSTSTGSTTTSATSAGGGASACSAALTLSGAVTGQVGSGAVAAILTGAGGAQVTAQGTAGSSTIDLIATGGQTGVAVVLQVQPGAQRFTAQVSASDVALSSDGRVATFHHVVLNDAGRSTTVDGRVTCQA